MNLVIAALLLVVVNTCFSHSLLNMNILVSFIIGRIALARLEREQVPLSRPWDGFILLSFLSPTTRLFNTARLAAILVFRLLTKACRPLQSPRRRGILTGSLAIYAVLEIWLFAFRIRDAFLTLAILTFVGIVLWCYQPLARCDSRLARACRACPGLDRPLFAVDLHPTPDRAPGADGGVLLMGKAANRVCSAAAKRPVRLILLLNIAHAHSSCRTY